MVLLGSHFTIRTDHESLKEILNQVIQTPKYQKYLSKLINYDYTIFYKAGDYTCIFLLDVCPLVSFMQIKIEENCPFKRTLFKNRVVIDQVEK